MVKYRYGGVYTQGSGYTEKHTYVTQTEESTHREYTQKKLVYRSCGLER